MKKLTYGILVFSILIFLIALVTYLFVFGVSQKKTFYASVNITADGMGFDLNGTALTFGNVQIGGSSTRKINFDNTYPVDIIVYIKVDGNIKDILQYEEEQRIKSGESRKIAFTISTQNAKEEFYSGNVVFKIKPAL